MKIGQFSKLSHLTIKALRFYEKEGLLTPVLVDQWTGYRYYETAQLERAARILAYRQLDLSINDIKAIFTGKSIHPILAAKQQALLSEHEVIEHRLSILKHLIKEHTMKYQVTIKIIPACTVYYSETTLKRYSDMMQWIPAQGAECRQLNPDLECAKPPYEFCEYLDDEYRETDIRVRHSEAVVTAGRESANIKFRTIPETNVLSILHKGTYDRIGEAYAYLMRYAEENGYTCCGHARECYIDGIWNKSSVEDWLTEIQLPVCATP